MATTLTINLDDDASDRVLTAIGYNFGYRSQVTDPDDDSQTIANPESLADFVLRQTKQFLIGNVHSYESDTAAVEAIAGVAILII